MVVRCIVTSSVLEKKSQNHKVNVQGGRYSGVPIYALLLVYCAICNAAGCTEIMLR